MFRHASLMSLLPYVILFLSTAAATAQQAVPAVPDDAAGLPQSIAPADATDPAKLLARAQLLHRAKQYEQAGEIAARAYALATTARQRFQAALIVADSAAVERRFTRAKLWLRRADQNAATGEDSALVTKLYRSVQRLDPLTLQFQFSATPSNNVNNGAQNTGIEIGGLHFTLPSSGQQLSGHRADARAIANYRVSLNRVQRTDVVVDAFARKVWLDAAARAKAPGVEGSDFDYDQLAVGFRHLRLIWPDVGPSTIAAFQGRTWYGGALYSDWTQVNLGQVWRRDTATTLRFSLGLRRETNALSALSDSITTSLGAVYDRKISHGRGYALSGYVRDARSDSATDDYLAAGLGAGFRLGRIGGVEPRLSLAAETRDYRKWVITAGGRTDRTLSAALEAGFPRSTFYGFVPYVTVVSRRTWSDVDIYARNEYSASFAVRSRF